MSTKRVGLSLLDCCVAEPQVQGNSAVMEKQNKDDVHDSVTEFKQDLITYSLGGWITWNFNSQRPCPKQFLTISFSVT